MSSNDHNYVMSPETAEAVRGLLNVCGDTNEVQPTQLANRGQRQGSRVPREWFFLDQIVLELET